MDKRKLIILFTVFIDVLGIGIIVPILPFYIESYGVSPFLITVLYATFAFCSLFSAPLLGALSDRVGRRPTLIVSIFSTAVGWLIFAWAPSVIFLFIGRIIDGIAAGNFSIAQNYLIDISKSEKEKTHNLGFIGMIFGIGFIIGPAIGGMLSTISMAFPFIVVGGLALMNGIFALFFLPETNHNTSKGTKIQLNPFTPIIQSLKEKALLPIFAAWFIFGLAIAIDHAILPLYLNAVFGFGSFISGLFLTGIGVIIAVNQGFAIKYIWLKYFKESSLVIKLAIFLTFGYFFMSTKYLIIFLLGILLTSTAQSVIRIILTSQAAKKSSVLEQGRNIGVLASIMSLAMIIGPLLAGISFTVKPSLSYFISACITVILVFILVRAKRTHKIDD